MRRLAVKNSARPQAVAATNSGRERRRAVASIVRPSDWPIDWPMKPTANSRIAAAIETKMSLKPVISRNCSSSTAGVARCWSMKARKRVGRIGADRARCHRLVEVVLAVHDHILPVAPSLREVCYYVNTLGQRGVGRRRSGGWMGDAGLSR